MTNIYWSVYRNLESEMIKLFYSIHIDDNQLGVYSSKISDLILRAAIEIESLSKYLYSVNGGKKGENILYDEVALKHLNKLWNLDQKKIIISSINCFQSKKEISPFIKNEKKEKTERLTYGWNNSYQNLKHDRGNSLEFGSLKYLFEIMAALFTLNLYFKDEVFNLGKEKSIVNFPINMGSEIFTIKLNEWNGHDLFRNHVKEADFNECIYMVRLTNQFLRDFNETYYEMQRMEYKLFHQHPKYQQYIKENNISDYEAKNLMFEILGETEYTKIIRSPAALKHVGMLEKREYECVLNKMIE